MQILSNIKTSTMEDKIKDNPKLVVYNVEKSFQFFLTYQQIFQKIELTKVENCFAKL